MEGEHGGGGTERASVEARRKRCWKERESGEDMYVKEIWARDIHTRTKSMGNLRATWIPRMAPPIIGNCKIAANLKRNCLPEVINFS